MPMEEMQTNVPSLLDQNDVLMTSLDPVDPNLPTNQDTVIYRVQDGTWHPVVETTEIQPDAVMKLVDEEQQKQEESMFEELMVDQMHLDDFDTSSTLSFEPVTDVDMVLEEEKHQLSENPRKVPMALEESFDVDIDHIRHFNLQNQANVTDESSFSEDSFEAGPEADEKMEVDQLEHKNSLEITSRRKRFQRKPVQGDKLPSVQLQVELLTSSPNMTSVNGTEGNVHFTVGTSNSESSTEEEEEEEEEQAPEVHEQVKVNKDFAAIPVCDSNALELDPTVHERGDYDVLMHGVLDNERVKVISMDPTHRSAFRQEVSILFQLGQALAQGEIDRAVSETLLCYCEECDLEVGQELFQNVNYYVVQDFGDSTLRVGLNELDARSMLNAYPLLVQEVLRLFKALHSQHIAYRTITEDSVGIGPDGALFFSDFQFAEAPVTADILASDIRRLGRFFAGLWHHRLSDDYDLHPKFGFEDLFGQMQLLEDASFDFDSALDHESLSYWGDQLIEHLEPTLTSPTCDFEEFLILRELGNGTDARTFVVEGPDGDQLVMKVQNAHTPLSDELQALDSLRDSGVAPKVICHHLRGAFSVMQLDGDRVLTFSGTAFVMEMVRGVTMEDFWFFSPSFPYTSAVHTDRHLRAQIRSMVATLIKLNDAGYFHLDTHLNNWIIDSDERVHLIDFSRARPTSGQRYDVAGFAPEIDPRRECNYGFGKCRDYDDATEVHVLGFGLKRLLDTLVNDLAECPLSEMPVDLEELLNWMTQEEKSKRPTFKQVLHHRALAKIRLF
jgi:serine/threonine protein kinase